jgi:hypothetical protein
MESKAAEEPEHLTEQEFHALYKLGELPMVVDDVIFVLSGSHLPDSRPL